MSRCRDNCHECPAASLRSLFVKMSCNILQCGLFALFHQCSVPIHAFARWDARARDPWICGTMDNICIHVCEAIFRIWFYFLVYWRWGVWPHTANDAITFYISIWFQSLLYWCSIQKITQFLHKVFPSAVKFILLWGQEKLFYVFSVRFKGKTTLYFVRLANFIQ